MQKSTYLLQGYRRWLCMIPVMAMCALRVDAQASEAAPARQTAARLADTVRVRIERASLQGGLPELALVSEFAERALVAFPGDPLLLHYRAYALYREALRTPSAGGAREARLNRAVELLRRSAALQPLPETQALLSTCLGQLASSGVMAGMRYGRAASAAGDSASVLGPSNPRVLLLAATRAWFTPKMWGGGEEKGYGLMQRALTAYAADAPARPLPAWGHAEAYAWLGQMEKQRGSVPAARAAYQRALDLEPGYPWVTRTLLPALDRAK